MRLVVDGRPEPLPLFAKLYSRQHVRADRWYKLGRALLYGRLEDERPFRTVRRMVQNEDYLLRVLRDAGLPVVAAVRLRRADPGAGVHAGHRVRGRGPGDLRRRGRGRPTS